jgi:hypothetical protein
VAEFVSLAARLLAPPSLPPEPEKVPVESHAGCALDVLALARCAALEAYERAVPRLLAALADVVLGRELALAPCDLSRLAALVRSRFESEEPVALWVAPGDQGRVTSDLPVRTDPALGAGDLVLEVRDGELESRFTLRLASALAATRAAV